MGCPFFFNYKFLSLLCMFFLLSPFLTAEGVEVGNEPTKRPNILLVITDDQRKDMVTEESMPNVVTRIKDRGVNFEKAYIVTPFCCPSRSAIYTGQYNSRNKVRGNNYRLKSNTIFKDLKGDYYQGIGGKYLNSHNGRRLSEFDYWAVHPFGAVFYYNQKFNVNGKWRQFVNQHETVTVYNFFNEFIQEKPNDQPFFFVAAFYSPHYPYKADRQDVGRFKDYTFQKPANFNVKLSNQPSFLKRIGVVSLEEQQEIYRQQLDCSYSADRQIGRMLDLLEEKNELEDTIVIYLSDNGVFRGEHGLDNKGYAYEENVIVPMYMRYDRKVTEPKTYNHLVANIDLAPTIYDFAGKQSSHKMDGVSLKPIFDGSEDKVREYLLNEVWSNNFKNKLSFVSMRNDRYVLIENYNSIGELYDLENDNLQLNNLYNNEQVSFVKQELSTVLKDTVKEIRGEFNWNYPQGLKLDKSKKYERLFKRKRFARLKVEKK